MDEKFRDKTAKINLATCIIRPDVLVRECSNPASLQNTRSLHQNTSTIYSARSPSPLTGLLGISAILISTSTLLSFLLVRKESKRLHRLLHSISGSTEKTNRSIQQFQQQYSEHLRLLDANCRKLALDIQLISSNADNLSTRLARSESTAQAHHDQAKAVQHELLNAIASQDGKFSSTAVELASLKRSFTKHTYAVSNLYGSLGIIASLLHEIEIRQGVLPETDGESSRMVRELRSLAFKLNEIAKEKDTI